MKNITVPGQSNNGKIRQPRGPFSVSRNRAWIFALVAERILAKPRMTAIDGNSFKVVRFFPKGQAIPAGEGDRCQQSSMSATEFFYCREVTRAHLAAVARRIKGAAFIPSASFWIEHVGRAPGEESWEVKYAMPIKFSIPAALELQSKLGSRPMLMMAEKIFKLDNEQLIS